MKEINSESGYPGRAEVMVIADGGGKAGRHGCWEGHVLLSTTSPSTGSGLSKAETICSRGLKHPQPPPCLLHLRRGPPRTPLRSVGEAAAATPVAILACRGLSLPPLPSSQDALVLGASPRLQPRTPASQKRRWKSTGCNPGSPKPRADVPPSACNSKRQRRNLLICC